MAIAASRMRKRWWWLAGLLVLTIAAWLGYRALRRHYFRQIQPPPLAAQPPLAELGLSSAAVCGKCHAAFLEEWQASAHGRAMTDPFFLTERSAEPALGFVCSRCHAPLDRQQPSDVTGLASLFPPRPSGAPNPRFDAALEAEGVTCLVCHQHGDALAGPLDIPAALLPHKTIVEPGFADPKQRCLRCHASAGFPGAKLLRPALATFDENAELKTPQSCVGCHMPELARPLAPNAPARPSRSHRILGARDPDFIRKHLDIEVHCDDRQCGVVLHNRAGHRMPTGEPGRVLRVRAGSREVALTRTFDRIKLVERPGDDNTLGVDETRRLTLPRPAEPARVVVELCLFAPNDEVLRGAPAPCSVVADLPIRP